MDEAKLAEIEARIPSAATQCMWCDRLATLRCKGCGGLLCDEHRDYLRDESPCGGDATEPVTHDHATADRTDLVAEVRRLAAALDAVTAERDAFRAIIEGRTAPPTFAERVAHMEAHRRNRWMARASTGAVVIGDFDDPPMWAALTTLIPVCWWPLDADGRPCAWPTAEVSR